MPPAVTLSVCRTCRPEGAPTEGEPLGAAVGRAVAAAARERGVEGVVEVKVIGCLSACSRACTASVSGAAKFGYVIGGMTVEDADDLVAFALAHADSADGIPPWRARPERVRKSTVARIPPHGVAHALVEEPVEQESVILHR